MNIKEAKEEVKNSIRAYLMKDESGAYVMEEARRRPLLLMGPPGIGKTAIMEQIAGELQINLVSYTITHHTRQSAIGLPVVLHRTYGGREYAVTEYTMSEIIGAVYEKIEETGRDEGILFLDEINCVSETLMPTMLQFLQYKMFGTHKVPEGFVIVCAGNPPQYNRAVREFDIVTLDRLRRIDIQEDLSVWMSYASMRRIHGAITAFLDIKKDCFYKVTPDIEELSFVTARGWEDLSATMRAYEKLSLPLTADVVGGFLQDHGIAEQFALFYELYVKYHKDFRVDDILSGAHREAGDEFKDVAFDEKIALLHLLNDALDNDFFAYDTFYTAQKERYHKLKTKGSVSEEEKAAFRADEERRMAQIGGIQEKLNHALLFLDRTFGQGQELVMFLSALSAGFYSKKFLHECGSEEYDKYSGLLLVHKRRQDLKNELMRLED